MKKILVFFLCLIIVFPLCSCSNKNEELSANTLDYKCYNEIEKIEGVENLSDETIKALSIIVRTNINNGDFSNSNNENQTNLLDESNSNRIKGLINYTSGQILTNNNSNNNYNLNGDNNNNKICYYINTNPNTIWKKEIKKYEILSFLDKEGISLANLSTLSFSSDDDGRVTELYVGGKSFPFKMFAEKFNLLSDKITNINSSISSITIEGIDKGYKGDIDLLELNNLSSSSNDYLKILTKLFPEKMITVIDISK